MTPALFNEAWIGSDESGKGDYFGPMVVAAVWVDAKIASALLQLGVRDSKRLSDMRAVELAKRIKATCPNAVVVIGPQRYNELMAQLRNVNRLLAWGHARAIENILEKMPCERAITDQFGDEAFVRQALLERGKKISLEQRPRAEEDPAVAAASILARAEFLSRLDELGGLLGERLPKGASSAVEEAAVRLVARHGPNVLKRAVKFHFKTTQRVLAAAR